MPRYQVVTPPYIREINGVYDYMIEDYVFVEANTPADAVNLAIPMLKEQYPQGYYAQTQPDNDLTGLRVTIHDGLVHAQDPAAEQDGVTNRNATPPAPVERKQG